MFIAPQGPDITADQARTLNDDFYRGLPYEFFVSRIASLITSASAPKAEGQLRADFAEALGVADPASILNVSKSSRETQIAIDSLVLRHHVAEALVRLYHALVVGSGDGEASASLWAAITNGPRQTAELVFEAMGHLRTDAGKAEFPGLVLPPNESPRGPLTSEKIAQVRLMAEWLCHGAKLLDRDDIDVNAAHNKLKHGLAARSRDDLLITFIRQPLNPDGTVPLSALNSADAVEIIDSVSVDYLARPRPVNRRKQGLEVTTLRLAPSTLLAEAWMMALTYGAMFHVAAATYFDNPEVSYAPYAPYPDVPLFPTPGELLKGTVIGIRRPLTTPPDGGEIDRGVGIAFHEGFVPMEINISGGRSTVIADN